jgi:hypothetical protein
MFDSEALPSTPAQRFINELANADTGSVLTDPRGRIVTKESNTELLVNGTRLNFADYSALLVG